MCVLSHGQFKCRDRYEGETDKQYERNIAAEHALAAYQPKAKKPADPFAGIPQSDEDKW